MENQMRTLRLGDRACIGNATVVNHKGEEAHCTLWVPKSWTVFD